jgi:hypothetical protein
MRIRFCYTKYVAYWHLTDLPILHNHVRLARQTGNHLNLLSISADDPTETWAAQDFRSAKALFVPSLKRDIVPSIAWA